LQWNVLFVNIHPPDRELDITVLQEELKEIGPGIRRTTKNIPAGIMLSQRKLGAGGLDKIDLKVGEVREIPLLMVHLLDCRVEINEDTKENIRVFPIGVAAYGISFPGEKNGRRIQRLATYQVNTTWMKKRYSDEIENDEDMGSDI